MKKTREFSAGRQIKYQFQKMPQLGALTILVVAVIFFGFLSPANSSGISAFLTLKNLGNLIEQTMAISMCAFGMTMVLLIGGIDLSVGSVIGLTLSLIHIFLRLVKFRRCLKALFR